MKTDRFDLVVVGGGPAGSTAAAIAARQGLRVLLLEAGSHPRAHVGESLLTGIIPILDAMGALDAVQQAGFTDKTGATYWGWGRTDAWDLWFAETETYESAWLVERARFDAILFRAAASAGAEVHENARAEAFLWEVDRVVGVEWGAPGQERRHALAPFTIDATGQAATMARKLGLRDVLEGLKHEASWAHYEGSGRLPAPRDKQALFIAEAGQWLWHFPLSQDLASVGMVTTEGGPRAEGDRTDRFDRAVAQNERLVRVLGAGARRVSPVRTVLDWSYRMTRICGPGWILAGDASGFIDPVLSSGVMLAMHAAFHAATMVAQVARGELTEHELQRRYDTQHRRLFDDMLRMVKFFYQQNLGRDDYFWESKRILLDTLPEVRPSKSVAVLTSGLVRNLAFDSTARAALERRQALEDRGQDVEGADPDTLAFVCVGLRYTAVRPPVALYFLIEPRDPREPALFRTPNWHLTCLAPRFQNDPIRVPEIAPHLRELERIVREADTRAGESLASFWPRVRGAVAAAVAEFPPELEVVRVYGE
jgi:flavin-dependent dehydrogenase